jgi:hypothetical protein
METCGYVENRKLSKLKFEGNKDIAKNVILGGLEKLHETGSPFMAMEAMEDYFKNPQRSGQKPNPQDIADKLATLRADELKGRAERGEPVTIGRKYGETQENEPVDLKLDLSEIENDVLCNSSERVVGEDILNYEPFKSLPDTREQATNMRAETTSLRNVNGELHVIYSKEDVLGDIIKFKIKYREEPIFCNIHVNTDRNIPNADIVNLPKKDSFDPRPYGSLDEKEIDEVSSTTGSLGLSSPINPIGYEPKNMETESKIYEALNALKKKITDESEEELDESTTTVSAGPLGYATAGFPPSKFMGTAGKKGKAPVNMKKKTPIWPGGKIVEESLSDETTWHGGSFVELDDCTKLNNNKEAQNGGCSTGAVDGVVKLKSTSSNITAPSLGKKRQ